MTTNTFYGIAYIKGKSTQIEIKPENENDCRILEKCLVDRSEVLTKEESERIDYLRKKAIEMI